MDSSGTGVGTLTISRDSREIVQVRITDQLSGVRFAEIHMTLSDFALAVTGMAFVEGTLLYRGLDSVGKKKVIESREAMYSGTSYDRAELESWLVENHQEAGWAIDPALRSQGSVSTHDGKTILRYSVHKFIDVDAELAQAAP